MGQNRPFAIFMPSHTPCQSVWVMKPSSGVKPPIPSMMMSPFSRELTRTLGSRRSASLFRLEFRPLQQERHQVAAAMWIDQRHRFISSQRSCRMSVKKARQNYHGRAAALSFSFIVKSGRRIFRDAHGHAPRPRGGITAAKHAAYFFLSSSNCRRCSSRSRASTADCS